MFKDFLLILCQSLQSMLCIEFIIKIQYRFFLDAFINKNVFIPVDSQEMKNW